MAQIDIKNCILRFTDGRQATLTTTHTGGVNGRILLTDASTHRGTRGPVRIALVVAGLNTALSVSVSGYDITVNVATDGAGAATSTAAQVRTALLGSAAAVALVTPTLPGTGALVVEAQAITALASGPRTLELRVGDGSISWVEKKTRRYIKNRGILDTVQDGDEEPVEVRLQLLYEYYSAVASSGTPTPIEVLDKTGEAAAWTSSDADPCNPYCVDIEVFHDPNCSGVANEVVTLQDFRWTQRDIQLKEGVIDITGTCNVLEALVTRDQ